jgi:hypothetical protein
MTAPRAPAAITRITKLSPHPVILPTSLRSELSRERPTAHTAISDDA